MYQQLSLDFTEQTAVDTLAAFIGIAAQYPEVVAASQNFVNRLGNDLRPSDIRQMRAAVKLVDGYEQLNWTEYENFLQQVAYGVTGQ
jgi:hypothetical protein